MRILGQAWKERIGGRIVSAVRRHSGGVPAPTRTTAVRRLVARRDAANAGVEMIRWDDEPAHAVPPRSVGGDLAGFAAVADCLEGDVRVLLERVLSGAVRQPATRRFAARLRHGRVMHHSGIVLADGGTAVVGDVSAIGFGSPLPNNPLRLSHLPRLRREPLAIAVVSTGTSWNYFHWMTEALPRIADYQRCGWPVDRYCAPVPHRFHRESLRLLGIPADRILPATATTHVAAERLLVAPVTGVLSAGKLEFLAARLTAALPPARPSGRRLFIVRRGRGPRSIVNEAAVRAALEPLGFEPRRLESLPLAEQIAEFHGAECVVGPHGAGLTNLVFCRPGTRVVEIGTPFRPWTCFWEIAHHRGLAYHLHLARPVRVRRFDRSNAVGDSDMAVDPAALRADVERLLASPAAPAGRAA